jgi:hypothetical protein
MSNQQAHWRYTAGTWQPIDDPNPGEPTESQLRAAGVQLHVDRLRAEFEMSLTTRRARLAWRLAGLISRCKRWSA